MRSESFPTRRREKEEGKETTGERISFPEIKNKRRSRVRQIVSSRGGKRGVLRADRSAEQRGGLCGAAQGGSAGGGQPG